MWSFAKHATSSQLLEESDVICPKRPPHLEQLDVFGAEKRHPSVLALVDRFAKMVGGHGRNRALKLQGPASDPLPSLKSVFC